MRFIGSISVAFAIAVGLTACMEEEKAEAPPPAQLTHEAIGYYCNMTVKDHHGPKGQVRLKSQDKPVWFSSVRDTIAFTRLPEEPKDIAAIYVTDMSKAETWEKPGDGAWIDAKSAVYVLGSSKKGGMGAPEAVPFSTKEAAEKFASHHGGKVTHYADIPDSSILGTVQISDDHARGKHDGHEKAENSEHQNKNHDDHQKKAHGQ